VAKAAAVARPGIRVFTTDYTFIREAPIEGFDVIPLSGAYSMAHRAADAFEPLVSSEDTMRGNVPLTATGRVPPVLR
jgi:hypothetical protein